MGKPVRLLTDPQLPLADNAFAPAIHAVHEAGGDKIRALLRRAIELNGISIVSLDEETGYDEKQLGRALKDDGGAHPPLPLVACILAKDRLGVVVQGLASMCGYEAKKKEADLGAENKRLRSELARIRADLDAVLEDA
jgi:hypothetical protein